MPSADDMPDGRGERTDPWYEWLLHVRHADDPGYAAVVKQVTGRFADRVLDAAELKPGATLLDVGAGDGLLGFRAIERVGPTLQVLFTDISPALLEHAEATAAARGIGAQCAFIEGSAESLSGVADERADAVVARASIAYVSDKRAAFREFYRVLKPGGRLSIAEPILQDEALAAKALRQYLDSSGDPDPFSRLLLRWKSAQYPDTEQTYRQCPYANFSERDLINLVREAGFGEVHMQLHINVVPSLITKWNIFLGCSPHPLAPPLRTIMSGFSEDERQLFKKLVRPAVESAGNMTIERTAYMQTTKPRLAPS
jgi:ubiquinone/menaquinone biosynthesis C-methylase UbiE